MRRWAGSRAQGRTTSSPPPSSVGCSSPSTPDNCSSPKPPRTLPPPTPGIWNGTTLALNVDIREQVDEVFASATQSGARGISPPQGRDRGGRSGYVAEPAENRWEIAWAPGVGFNNEAGALIEL
jgi:hypothetical protein